MRRACFKLAFVAIFLAATTTVVFAEVQIVERNRVEFTGLLGKMSGMFGGKAAKDGLETTTVVAGNRKLTRTGDQGELVDLDREVVSRIDYKKKRVEEVSFDEIRKQMQEAGEALSGRDDSQGGKEYEIDYDLQRSGETREIAGYSCEELVMTVTVREKGKSLEEGGGTILTSRMWLTDEADVVSEVHDFDRRYAEKLFGEDLGAGQFAAAAQMNPAFGEAFSRFQEERVEMEGSAILTTMTVETVGVEGQEGGEAPSISGVLGGFGRALGRKKEKKEEESSAPGRKTFMTMTNEIVSVSSDAPPVEIPAGFKVRN